MLARSLRARARLSIVVTSAPRVRRSRDCLLRAEWSGARALVWFSCFDSAGPPPWREEKEEESAQLRPDTKQQRDTHLVLPCSLISPNERDTRTHAPHPLQPHKHPRKPSARARATEKAPPDLRSALTTVSVSPPAARGPPP
jgi:hypothetical protein